MYEISRNFEEVIIHSTPDLMHMRKITIYQMQTKDGKIIVDFSKYDGILAKNTFFVAAVLFVLALIYMF